MVKTAGGTKAMAICKSNSGLGLDITRDLEIWVCVELLDAIPEDEKDLIDYFDHFQHIFKTKRLKWWP